MDLNRKLGMIVAYYLSRFDSEAVANLGYTTTSEAFQKISEILKVKRNTLKNWRDEFDPLHSHRMGWYQRPMSPSRTRVVESFCDLDEYSLRLIVKDIIQNEDFQNTVEAKELTLHLKDDYQLVRNSKEHIYILRGPTGKKAEEYFIKWFTADNEIFPGGRLNDVREMGCGYDFSITTNETEIKIEVKGLSGQSGGILFTNREWNTALKYQDKYILAVVRDVDTVPELMLLNNPATNLTANKYIYTSVQVNWIVKENELLKMSGFPKNG